MPLLGYIKNNKKVTNAYYLDIIGTPITYQDFMQLTPTQQENGNWYVTGMSPMVNAYSIMYKDGNNIGSELDRINSDIIIYQQTLTTGSTTVTFTSDFINSNSCFDWYSEDGTLNPSSWSVSNNTLTATYTAQSADVVVGVRISQGRTVV